MKPKPYVGVTGPTTEDDVRGLLKLFDTYGFSMSTSYIPMIGVLVSYKTLEQGRHPTRARYPDLEIVPRLLEAVDGKAFATVHYNTRTPYKLAGEVASILDLDDVYDNGLCDGVQLNVAWPPAGQIDLLKNEYPDLKIIFQLSRRASEGMTDDEVVERLAYEYGNLLDYILIDPSAGEGISFDINRSAAMYRKIKKAGIDANIGFAGGLSGENVSEVIGELKDILGTGDEMPKKRFQISVDTETRVRDDNDLLDLGRVQLYLEGALAGFFG